MDSVLVSALPTLEPPTTPLRPTSRYPPHLSKSRPLLHRRGTSHMYETLEDLLKEAGYKETRVFTPESERVKEQTTVRGTVVKLLSTWMNRFDPEHTGGNAVHHDPEHENVPPPPPPPPSSRLRHTASVPHIRGRSRRTTTTEQQQHRSKLYAHPNLNATSTSTATTATTQSAIAPAWLASLFSPRTPPASPVRSPRPRTQPRLLSHPRAASGVTITNVVCRPVTPRTPSSNKAARKCRKVPILICEPCDGHDSHRDGQPVAVDYEDDDDDDDVDLARMLIPAKRQHSIRSLRDVLATHPYRPRPASPVQRTRSAMENRERQSAIYAREERERASQNRYTVQGSLYNYASNSTPRPKSPLAYSSAQNYHNPHVAAAPSIAQQTLMKKTTNGNGNTPAPTHHRGGHAHRKRVYASQLSTSPTAMGIVHEQEPETPVEAQHEEEGQQPFSSLRVKRRRSGLPLGWVA